jgi:hypothetical protein
MHKSIGGFLKCFQAVPAVSQKQAVPDGSIIIYPPLKYSAGVFLESSCIPDVI